MNALKNTLMNTLVNTLVNAPVSACVNARVKTLVDTLVLAPVSTLRVLRGYACGPSCEYTVNTLVNALSTRRFPLSPHPETSLSPARWSYRYSHGCVAT